MTDLTILGAGIFGLACGFAAARRGARVTVIDPGGIGAGASGGLVGALTPHAPETWTPAKALQLQALLAAPQWWAAVEAASGRAAGYGRIGRVQPLQDERARAKAAERVAGAEALWRGQAQWQLRAWAPGDPVSASGWVVEDDLSARLHPRLALAALAGGIRALGGEIRTEGGMGDCMGSGLSDGAGDGAVGRAGDGMADGLLGAGAPHRPGPVIHATGAAGLRALSQDLGRDIGRGEKGQALSLGHDMGGRPQIYAPGLHIVPHVDGTVAIGSTSERVYDDARATDAQLEALQALAIATLPELAAAPVLERWAGERPRAATRAPLLDRHPLIEGHYLANGGFKTGFAMAPLAAELLVDLILEGRDALPAAWRLPPAG